MPALSYLDTPRVWPSFDPRLKNHHELFHACRRLGTPGHIAGAGLPVFENFGYPWNPNKSKFSALAFPLSSRLVATAEENRLNFRAICTRRLRTSGVDRRRCSVGFHLT